MIDKIEEDKNIGIPSIIRFMSTSSFTFHLTGSRLFGGATETSDYDYFAQDSDELRNKLEAFGLDNITDHYTITEPEAKEANRDWDIAAVYRYKREDGFQIDVQLVHDYNRRKAIVRGMKLLGILPTMPKEYRWNAWNALYNIYTDGLLNGRKEKKEKRKWFKRN